MSTPVYHARPFYVQWCPSDTGGGNYAVRDRRDSTYVYVAADEPSDFTGKHEAACTQIAADLNYKHLEEQHRAEVERLHAFYLRRIACACAMLADKP